MASPAIDELAVDETYTKVCGRWAYLYRALDKSENTIDFYLSPTRNAKAAKRFLGKALNGLKAWEKPEVINTDKAPTYGIAISELKAEGKCPEKTMHRQVRYLNNLYGVLPGIEWNHLQFWGESCGALPANEVHDSPFFKACTN